jgi:CRISPR system Cascade subunit CasE
MFLSRIELDAGLRKTRDALSSPHVMHGIVEQSFVRLKERQRILWRIDMIDSRLYLLVQSETRPDFSHAVEQCGYPSAERKWETKDCSAFLESLKNGQKLRFRLCSNPTHSTGCKTLGGRGKVIAHTSLKYQKKWLIDKAPGFGFSVTENSFGIIRSDWKKFKKNGGNSEISILAVTFEGILFIEDAEKFRAAVAGGIGRGKAYGYGLISLAGF